MGKPSRTSSAAQAVTPDSTSATASGPATSTTVTSAAFATQYSPKAAAPLQATWLPGAMGPPTPGPTATTTPAPSAPSGKAPPERALGAKACSARARNVSQPPLMPAYVMRINTCGMGCMWRAVSACMHAFSVNARLACSCDC